MAQDKAARPDADDPKAVSRRRMMRGVAAATVAGAGAAAVVGSPAQAATGDPIKIGNLNDGTGLTSLTGSQFRVTADGQPAALEAVNATGASLLLGVNTAATFPPATGQYYPGAIVNWQGELFQCVDSDGLPNSTTLWTRLTNSNPVLTLLPQPVRVYASTKDSSNGNRKIGYRQSRRIDVSRAAGSGVPPYAVAVIGTVQLYQTETSSGYLAIASGDVTPSGFSTTVWSAAGFSGVTSFTSALGDPAGIHWGQLSVACYSSSQAAKTHFFIDIVGYYDYDLFAGGPGATAKSQTAGLGRTARKATPRR